MTNQDLYETLQVSPKADPNVIAAAYRRLALLYHPDRNNSPQATEMMARINVSYETLKDPRKRAEYDRERRGPKSSGSGSTNQDTRQAGNTYKGTSQSAGSGRANQGTGHTGSEYSRSQQSSAGSRTSQDSSRRQTWYEGESWSSHARNGPRPAGDQDDRIGFFGLEANRQVVIEVQGQAERVNVNHIQNKETWYYGRSTVEFSLSTGTVRRWADLARNLRVRMVPGQRTTASPTFGLGSHKDDVIRIQGTPSRIDIKAANRETWCFGYGYSTVDFQNPSGLVVGWRDIEKILKTGAEGGQRSHTSSHNSTGPRSRTEYRSSGQPAGGKSRAYGYRDAGGPSTHRSNEPNQQNHSRVKGYATPGGQGAHQRNRPDQQSERKQDGRQDWSWVTSETPAPQTSNRLRKFLRRKGIGTKLKVAAAAMVVAGILIATGQGNILIAFLMIGGGGYFLYRRWQKGRI